VATGAATDVTQTTANLAGTVNPNGTNAGYLFQYGPTTAYGTSTPILAVGQGTADVAAAASLASLTPGTTYHYRLVASNAGGETQGSDATFTTATPPPVVVPPPTTPKPPPPDTTAPVVTVANAASQSVAKGVLAMTVTPAEATSLILSARITIPGAKAINVKGKLVAASAGKPAKLVLKLSKKTRAAIRAALARGKKVRAKLTLKATDAAGNVTTKSATVRLR
jgi:hypothetical protein